MDKNNPKPELDGILIDGNKLVCCDTKQILILEFKESFCATKKQTTMLFEKLPKEFSTSLRPKNFTKILDANGGIVEELGFKLCVPSHYNGTSAQYVDYKRISYPKLKKTYKHTKLDFDGYKNSDDLLLFKSTILNNSLFDGRFLAKFSQLLLKMHMTFDVTIHQEDTDKPLYICAKVREESDTPLVKIDYVVMPIILDEKDRQVA